MQRPRHTDHTKILRDTAEALDENNKIAMNLMRRFITSLSKLKPDTRRAFYGVLNAEPATEEHFMQALHGGESFTAALRRIMRIETSASNNH